MSPETIELLVSTEAMRALGVGVVFALIAAAAGYWWTQSHDVALPAAGIALVVAFLVAAPETQRPTLMAVVGIFAAAAAGLLGGDRLIQALASLPGAILVAVSLPAEVGMSLRVLVVLVIPVGGALVAEFDMRYQDRALATPLFAIATLGVFFAVPDTEHAIVLLMVAAPFVFVSWPLPLAALGPSGSFAVVALMMWVIASDAFARPLTALGASTVLAILVAEPIVARLFGPEKPSLHSNVFLVWGSQLIAVYVASRIAAPRQPFVVALIASALSLAVAGGLSFALSREEFDTGRRSPRGGG